MTLATRCPACQITFKVVRDQLRLAEGWVRCGRCETVFRAEDTLAPWAAPGDAVERAVSSAEAERAPDSTDVPSPPDVPVSTQVADSPQRPLSPSLPEPIPHTTTPRPYAWETVRQESPRAHPWRTAGWALAALTGAAALLTQVVVFWHDEVALAAPALRPALEVGCVLAECKLEPVRRLDALSVEASQLAQLGGTIYQLNATVRNRAPVELAAPALDLVLTGTQGQVLARKVLRWTDFGLRTRSIAAQQELSLQINLNTGSAEVSGFTIELFYP